jgi:succinyl-CoA synthetase beta subunit
VLLAGSGGVLAEALRDVRLFSAELTAAEILNELQRLQCAPLLRGFRGSPALDVEAVAQMLVALGRLVRTYPEIEEVEINPVAVYPKGDGAHALDALMKVAEAPAEVGERGAA